MGFTLDCDSRLSLRWAKWSQYQVGISRHNRQHLAYMPLNQIKMYGNFRLHGDIF